MFCKNCGKEINDQAVICPYCGVADDKSKLNQMSDQTKKYDYPSAGYAILCFFFPIVGLILYLVWKDEYPQRAKSCGKGALISVIVGAVCAVLYVILVIILITVGIGMSGLFLGFI